MKEPEILPQQARENDEPHESSGAIPWGMLFLVTMMVAFGVVYIAGAPLDTSSELGDGRTIAELTGESAAKGAKADGAAIYASLCIACHQANGKGLSGVFPPLASSEWVNGKDAVLAAIVLQGVNGALTVSGSQYNGTMPSFKAQLDDEQLAALLTYLRGQWGNSGVPINALTVAEVRGRFPVNAGPLEGDRGLAALAP